MGGKRGDRRARGGSGGVYHGSEKLVARKKDFQQPSVEGEPQRLPKVSQRTSGDLDRSRFPSTRRLRDCPGQGWVPAKRNMARILDQLQLLTARLDSLETAKNRPPAAKAATFVQARSKVRAACRYYRARCPRRSRRCPSGNAISAEGKTQAYSRRTRKTHHGSGGCRSDQWLGSCGFQPLDGRCGQAVDAQVAERLSSGQEEEEQKTRISPTTRRTAPATRMQSGLRLQEEGKE